MGIYRLSNRLVMKATRGRPHLGGQAVRTPKVRQSDGLVPWRACAKQDMPVRSISHKVRTRERFRSWSAMRPRIAFCAPKRCGVRRPQPRSPREREQRITNNPSLPLTSILSPWKGEADDKATRFHVAARSDLVRFSSSQEERGKVGSWEIAKRNRMFI